MDSWFEIKQIEQDTFVISEPKHWEETHCYLLCGEKRAVLIDTGLGVPQMILHDGDCIELGNRNLVVIHTPGHSPGHCCFYERDRKYLYSGDLIYSGCLDAFYPSTNPKEFWESVRKIQSLEINRIFPGHHHLSISVSIIDKIENAFHNLSNEGKLEQGNGIFSYDDFQIHI